MAMGEKELLKAISDLCREHIAGCNAAMEEKQEEWSSIDTPLALLDYDAFMAEKENAKELSESILMILGTKLQAVS